MIWNKWIIWGSYLIKKKKKKTDETSIVEVKYLDSVKFYTMEIFQILLINNNDR